MASFNDLIKSARLPEDSAPICLRGDLVRQHEALEVELEEADRADRANSLGSGGARRKIAAEIDALEKQMQEHTHRFAFRGLPQREYRDLLEQHPPREGRNEDMVWGGNIATFPHALIAASCIDPVMTEQQVGELAAVLTDGQIMEMFQCTLALNRGSVDIPKSAAASAILQRPGPKSKQPAPGESPESGSSAGSLAG